MSVSRDGGDPHPWSHDAVLRARVDQELAQLLQSVTEVDLATVYRTIAGLLGAHVAPHIAEVIGSGLRKGTIAMEPRSLNSDAPAVAWVRRVVHHSAAA